MLYWAQQPDETPDDSPAHFLAGCWVMGNVT